MYQFLGPQDTLGLLEEDGKLKGYIDVLAGEDESDAILSYQITIGSRSEDRVVFKTSKIHQKYFRFSGRVQRGSGRKEGDADYLRLVGDLEIVTVKDEAGSEAIEHRSVTLKSRKKGDEPEGLWRPLPGTDYKSSAIDLAAFLRSLSSLWVNRSTIVRGNLAG